MTSEQARKLLGGYATNSLTEAERKALFEAALDDQELFDALQQEQALKELLADPISRNQIQQALADAPVSRAAGAAWWSRWWAWGGVASAIAAAVLIVAVIRSNEQRRYDVARVAPVPQASEQDSRSGILTPAEPKPKQAAPAPRKAMRAARVLRQPAATTSVDAVGNTVTVQPQAASPPPPPPAPQATAAAVQPGQQSSRSQQGVQVQTGAQQASAGEQVQALRQEQFARDGERPPAAKAMGALAGTGGFVANYKGPLLQYSLVKRDPGGAYSALPAGVPPKSGDALRVIVNPAVSGYLSLYQLDPSGDWKRVFPAGTQDLLVGANAPQTIPDSPIMVKDTEQKLRLMLVPLTTQPELAKDSQESAAKTKTLAAPLSGRAATPLVVDITIGPNKIP